MKKRLVVTISIIACLVLSLSFAIPALATRSLSTQVSLSSQNDILLCSKCGKDIHRVDSFGNRLSSESQLAKALGLTLCIQCWQDILNGSDRSDTLPAIVKLDESGKIPSIQLGGTDPKGDFFLRSDRTWVAVSGGSAVWGGITGTLSTQTDLQGVLDSKLSSFTELDPVFGQSVAYGISSGDITNWNTAFVWGNHASAGYELLTNKGITSGYAGLDAGSKVPTVNLGGAGASGSTYLRGDQTWASVTASPPDPVTNINLVDEFMGGSLEAGEVGNLGWSFTTTAPTVTASVASHPGIRRINTSATSGNVNAFWTGAAANNDLIRFDEQWDFNFIVSIPTITTVEVFCGAIDATTTAVGNQDRYGLAFNPATSAFWRMTTGNGSSSTSTDTNVTVVAGTWCALRIVRTATGVDYYIDGALKGSISTTLPDTALSFGACVQTLTTVARNLDVDFFRMTLALSRTGAK